MKSETIRQIIFNLGTSDFQFLYRADTHIVFRGKSFDWQVNNEREFHSIIENLKNLCVNKESYSITPDFPDLSFEEHLKLGSGVSLILKIELNKNMNPNLIFTEIMHRNIDVFMYLRELKKYELKREWV